MFWVGFGVLLRLLLLLVLVVWLSFGFFFWRGFWITYPEESASCKAVINDKQPWHVIDFRLKEIGPIIK